MSRKRRAVFFLALAVIALGVGYVVYSIAGRANRNAVYDEIQETAVSPTPAPTPVPTPVESPALDETPAPTEEVQEPVYVSPIDFETLWEINEDIYAWIEIPDTVVRYPIVQSPSNDNYYLDHTIEGKAGYPGSIFTCRVNAKDFTDFNTVVYGHNMKDNSMFGSLSDYRDLDFLQTHTEIKVYTPEKELTYRVFAAVIYDDRLITSAFDNSDPAACRRFLDTIYGNRNMNSHVLQDVEVTEADRILTLSTCIGGRPNNRYLVLAVLTDEIS